MFCLCRLLHQDPHYTPLGEKTVFSSNPSLCSQLGNTFSLLKRPSVSASRWLSGQESMNTLKKAAVLKALQDSISTEPCLLPGDAALSGSYTSTQKEQRQMGFCSATSPRNGKVIPMKLQCIYSTALLGVCFTFAMFQKINT